MLIPREEEPRWQILVTVSFPARGKRKVNRPKVVLPSATTPSWGGPSTRGPHSVSFQQRKNTGGAAQLPNKVHSQSTKNVMAYLTVAEKLLLHGASPTAQSRLVGTPAAVRYSKRTIHQSQAKEPYHSSQSHLVGTELEEAEGREGPHASSAGGREGPNTPSIPCGRNPITIVTEEAEERVARVGSDAVEVAGGGAGLSQGLGGVAGGRSGEGGTRKEGQGDSEAETRKVVRGDGNNVGEEGGRRSRRGGEGAGRRECERGEGAGRTETVM